MLTARRASFAAHGADAAGHNSPGARLTPRQLEVLTLLCEGLPNKLICRRLNISAGTVKAHISSVLRELGVASRVQAVIVARRRGLVGEDQCGVGQLNAATPSGPAGTSINFAHRAGSNPFGRGDAAN
jgi:DNA-binding CsgD family transcriptional regulator